MADHTMQPPVKARKRKAPTLREDDWEPYKDHIVNLYTTGISLQQVKEAMENQFDFCAEIRQYKSRINKWKLDKNVKPKEMKTIVRKRQKRRIDEKDKGELVFYVRKSHVDPAKIDRWMARHSVPQDPRYSPSPSAPTPSDIDCHTISDRGTPVPSPVISRVPVSSPRWSSVQAHATMYGATQPAHGHPVYLYSSTNGRSPQGNLDDVWGQASYFNHLTAFALPDWSAFALPDDSMFSLQDDPVFAMPDDPVFAMPDDPMFASSYQPESIAIRMHEPHQLHKMMSAFTRSQGAPGTYSIAGPSGGLSMPHAVYSRRFADEVLSSLLRREGSLVEGSLVVLATEFGRILERCPEVTSALTIPRKVYTVWGSGTHPAVMQEYQWQWESRSANHILSIKRTSLGNHRSAELLILQFFVGTNSDTTCLNFTLHLRMEGGQIQNNKSDASVRAIKVYMTTRAILAPNDRVLCDATRLHRVLATTPSTLFDRSRDLTLSTSILNHENSFDRIRLLIAAGASTRDTHCGHDNILWRLWIDFFNPGLPKRDMTSEISQSMEMTCFLLDHGAQIDECVHFNPDAANFLFLAAEAKHEVSDHLEHILSFLLGIGSDLEIRNCNELTPLLFAAKSTWPGSLSCLSSIIHHGADVFAVENHGSGALHVLISSFKELFEHWPHMNGPLGCCSENTMNTRSIVEDKLILLLNAGCDIFAVDHDGLTPDEYLPDDEVAREIWFSALNRSCVETNTDRIWEMDIVSADTEMTYCNDA